MATKQTKLSKILLVGDIHGSATAIKEITKKSKSVDIIVCVGDFTTFERNFDKIFAKLDSLNKKILILHGNHESLKRVKHASKHSKNIVFIHDKFFVFNNIIVYGYGGGGFSFNEPLLERKIPKLKKKFLKYQKKIENSKAIIVYHQPPYGVITDNIFELKTHVGSKTKMRLVKEITPDVVVSGHIHETNYKKETKNDVLFINPGPKGRIIRL